MFKKALSIGLGSLLVLSIVSCSNLQDRIGNIENKTFEPLPTRTSQTLKTTETEDVTTTTAEPSKTSETTASTTKTSDEINPDDWSTAPVGGSSRSDHKIQSVSGTRQKNYDEISFNVDTQGKSSNYRIKYADKVTYTKDNGEAVTLTGDFYLKTSISGLVTSTEKINKDIQNVLKTAKLKNVKGILLTSSSDGVTDFVITVDHEAPFNVVTKVNDNKTSRTVTIMISDKS